MKVRFPVAVIAAMVALGLGAGQAAAGPGVELSPHRAVYAMSLNSTRLGGGVTGASGAMTYKFGDSCDGWTVENKTALNFSYNDGAPVATTWDFVTWESKDGLHYRFRVRSTRDGVVSEEIDGVPKGTLFPTEHTIRLLEAAQKGSHVVERTLFDGTGTDGPFDVNAVLGKELAANADAKPAGATPAINAGLLGGPSWRMQMAFFLQGSKDATPDYEVALRYYLNGVADEVIQSFGNFSLKGTLQQLEPLPKPEC